MCGIVGIIEPKTSNARGVSYGTGYETYHGLLALQHRGQDAAGILSYDSQSSSFVLEKDMGLVNKVFDQARVERLHGHIAIGHTRYATVGGDGTRDIQPMVMGTPFGFGMVHNGNILNYFSLARDLSENYGRQLLTGSDLEVVMQYWSLYLMQGKGYPDAQTFTFENISQAVKALHAKLIGGYAVLAVIAGQGMVAFRDPKGIRPMVMGTRLGKDGKTAYGFASESVALGRLGFSPVRDVAPGEVFFINENGDMRNAVVTADNAPAPCMFEWVYFSGAESEVDGGAIYTTRLNLGMRLAEKAKKLIAAGEISPDVVVPVPDTSRPATIAIADCLGLPYREALIKNRYVARSFILSSQEEREAAVEQKLIPVRSEIEGKSIFLIDDSVVRGTTSQKLVALLRKYGAREVVLGVTCPPIRHACYYGIDFPDPSVLVAKNRTEDDIAATLGAEKIVYLDEDDLRAAIGVPALCMACLNNRYPTDIGEGRDFSKQRSCARKTG